MLSYQHIYHAGCLPDIHKHMALAELLNLMVKKDKPLTYFETHAGRGYYDLNAPEARKTGEAAEGILRMMKDGWFSPTRPFLRVIQDTQSKKGMHIYPGSAAIAEYCRRPGDKMHLMELHPGEIKHLRSAFKNRSVNIQQKEGLAALLAIAPPQPRRGLPPQAGRFRRPIRLQPHGGRAGARRGLRAGSQLSEPVQPVDDYRLRDPCRRGRPARRL